MASSEFKVQGSDGKEHRIRFQGSSSGTINEVPFELDILSLKAGSFHVLKDNQSWNIEVLRMDSETKTVTLSINGSKYTMQVKDQYDELLHNLGLDSLSSKKVNELKAPMPGLVAKVRRLKKVIPCWYWKL